MRAGKRGDRGRSPLAPAPRRLGGRGGGVEKTKERAKEWRSKVSWWGILAALSFILTVLWAIVGVIHLFNVVRLAYLSGSVMFWFTLALGLLNALVAVVFIILSATGVEGVHKVDATREERATIEARFMLEDRNFSRILALATASCNAVQALAWGFWFVENNENADSAQLRESPEQFGSYLAVNALGVATCGAPLLVLATMWYASSVRRSLIAVQELVVLRSASGQAALPGSLERVMSQALSELHEK